MTAFEAVTILAVAGTVIVGLVDYLRSGSVLSGAGQRGGLWFEHSADRPIEERPSEDERDAPIPRRRLRGR